MVVYSVTKFENKRISFARDVHFVPFQLREGQLLSLRGVKAHEAALWIALLPRHDFHISSIIVLLHDRRESLLLIHLIKNCIYTVHPILTFYGTSFRSSHRTSHRYKNWCTCKRRNPSDGRSKTPVFWTLRFVDTVLSCVFEWFFQEKQYQYRYWTSIVTGTYVAITFEKQETFWAHLWTAA